MRQVLSRGLVRLVLAVGIGGILIAGAYGVYLLGMAGALPGQAEPTRIPTTPFADIPGFAPPKIVVATPTGA